MFRNRLAVPPPPTPGPALLDRAVQDSTFTLNSQFS